MKETKVICPVCGAELELDAHEHQVKNATTIAKDSGLGVVYLPMKKNKTATTKAEKRIEAMRAKGIKTDGMFAIKGTDDKFGVIIEGEIRMFSADDENVEKIINGGTIPDRRLFKQHVLAQMLRMLTSYDYKEKDYERDHRGYYMLDRTIIGKHSWYEYAWKVLTEELGRQASMHKHKDLECFVEDNRWYNKELALIMMDNHIRQLHDLFDCTKRHKHKGNLYIKYRGAEKIMPNKDSRRGYLYVDEFDTFFRKLREYRNRTDKAYTPGALYEAVKAVYSILPGLYIPASQRDFDKDYEYALCEEFINAYKGYGGYFSMQNLIRFHDCRICVGNGKFLSKESSLDTLNTWAEEHKDEGYWMLGALKQLLRDNNFDIAAKRKEWRDKYTY